MTIDLSQVSWLGVIVGTAIYFFLGALWSLGTVAKGVSGEDASRGRAR